MINSKYMKETDLQDYVDMYKRMFGACKPPTIEEMPELPVSPLRCDPSHIGTRSAQAPTTIETVQDNIIKKMATTLGQLTGVIERQNKKIDELERKNEELFDKINSKINNMDFRLTQQENESVNDADMNTAIMNTAEQLARHIKEYVDEKDEAVKAYTHACADAGVHNARNCGESNSMEEQGKILVKREDEEE